MFHLLLESFLPEFDQRLVIYTFQTLQWKSLLLNQFTRRAIKLTVVIIKATRLEDNTEMDLREIGWGGMAWVHLA